MTQWPLVKPPLFPIVFTIGLICYEIRFTASDFLEMGFRKDN